MQYLADRKPAAALAPAAGTLERYRLQEWLTFISSEIHKTFGALFVPTTTPEVRKERIETLGKRFALADQMIAGKQFVLGNGFSAADAYLFVMLSWADHLKLDLANLKNLQALKGRIAARPGVQKALKEEGLA